ncbi:MAG: Unknown protein [uncultured Sulfurovum sp.]|uniref:Uncharacterized protein n=1 Tax=uncultured Sulfurovum sp. TaxID=269237 RepID=A0A6S6RTD6_9BACT|nr:MAG: Unknown protein [uncultured Sulfurovum sp.]
MTSIKSLNSTVNFFQSILIALILALTIVPIIFLLTSANASWVIMATLLWAIGSLFIFHPFLLYVYPHLITKAGVYLLTSVLIIISVWFNISIITFFLPDNYLYYGLINATLTKVALWGSIYLIFINALITNFILISNIDFYKEESLF